jgi:hypothetical protein
MSSPTFANARLQDVIAGDTNWLATSRRVAAFVLKSLVGAWFCQGMFGFLGGLNFLGAVVVIGWTYRLMQRSALKAWWRRSDSWNDGVRFQSFATSDPEFRPFLTWPNWMLRQQLLTTRSHRRGNPGLLGRTYLLLRDLTHSLTLNFRIGARSILCTWTVTLIPMLLWAFAWHQGWDNSFNKGYEQAAVGPATYFLGIFLFIGVMFYLPMAQARQAVSGNWRAFFHFKAVRHLIRRRWFFCFILAGLYALAGLPVMAAESAIYFLGNNNPALENLGSLELYQYLNRYLFWISLLIILPAFVLLRLVAARIYASAMREAIESGDADKVRPSEFESNAFRALGIAERPKREHSLPTRFVIWTGSLGGRITAAILCAFIWFAFTIQPVVHTFIIIQPGLKGFLNRPLVQLPWFYRVPKQLAQDAGRTR